MKVESRKQQDAWKRLADARADSLKNHRKVETQARELKLREVNAQHLKDLDREAKSRELFVQIQAQQLATLAAQLVQQLPTGDIRHDDVIIAQLNSKLTERIGLDKVVRKTVLDQLRDQFKSLEAAHGPATAKRLDHLVDRLMAEEVGSTSVPRHLREDGFD